VPVERDLNRSDAVVVDDVVALEPGDRTAADLGLIGVQSDAVQFLGGGAVVEVDRPAPPSSVVQTALGSLICGLESQTVLFERFETAAPSYL